MRNISTTFIFLLLWINSFAQKKVCVFPHNEDGSITVLYDWKSKEAKQLKLPDLATSSDTLHFRYWTETGSVDIWTKDYKVFHGLLSNYTTSINPHKDKNGNAKRGKFYSNKTKIDTALARKAYLLFYDNAIAQIPSDEKIVGWDSGLDGKEYIIEYSKGSYYSFKKYWTPTAFPQIKEAVRIKNFLEKMDMLIDIKKSWNLFLDKLPKGCYRGAGAFFICTKIKPK